MSQPYWTCWGFLKIWQRCMSPHQIFGEIKEGKHIQENSTIYFWYIAILQGLQIWHLTDVSFHFWYNKERKWLVTQLLINYSSDSMQLTLLQLIKVFEYSKAFVLRVSCKSSLQVIQASDTSVCLSLRNRESLEQGAPKQWLHLSWHRINGRICIGPSPQRGSISEAFSLGNILMLETLRLLLFCLNFNFENSEGSLKCNQDLPGQAWEIVYFVLDFDWRE